MKLQGICSTKPIHPKCKSSLNVVKQPELEPPLQTNLSIVDKISNFVDAIRIETEHQRRTEQASTSKGGDDNQSRRLADWVVIEVEQFKAMVAPPKGNFNSDNDDNDDDFKRWDQAFRVYAAIYSKAHPDRSAEIWQYIHIIHTAAGSYMWDNVAYYDFTFRQLMARKPNRSWAKIYTQVWNLAMRDPLLKIQNHNSSGSGPSGNKSWRDNCCLGV